MQHQAAAVSFYPQENLSERHLAIFYRKSKAQRTLMARKRILRKFKVHTAEQAEQFEIMFDIAYGNICSLLKAQHASLSVSERVILAFVYSGLPDLKITGNMGITDEELRRQLFIISKKMTITVERVRTALPRMLQQAV